MIVPTNYDIKKDDPMRLAGFLQGAVMVVLPEDKLQWAWSGHGRGCDLLAVMIRSSSEIFWLMGRVRLHVDDRITQSRDHKEVVQIAYPSDMDPEEAVKSSSGVIGEISAVLGIDLARLRDRDLEGKPPEFMQTLLEEMSMEDADQGKHWDTNMVKIELPKDDTGEIRFNTKGDRRV